MCDYHVPISRFSPIIRIPITKIQLEDTELGTTSLELHDEFKHFYARMEPHTRKHFLSKPSEKLYSS